MNQHSTRTVFCPFTETSARIRSIDFNTFEKPKAIPHWSFDEALRTRAKRTIDLNAAMRALQTLSRNASAAR